MYKKSKDRETMIVRMHWEHDRALVDVIVCQSA